MSDVDDVAAVVEQWLTGLDTGNLEMMIETCDEEVVVCNEHQPTTVGIQAIRDKYAPKIAAATFTSGFETQHIRTYGDMALVVGHFTVEVTGKASGEKQNAAGRLALTYRRHPDGSWKMLLDLDNND